MLAKINLLTSFLLKEWTSIKELDNIISGIDIDKKCHKEIFENNLFEKIYTKVNLDNYKDIKNKIYWISLLIYRISMVNYLKSINKDVNYEKQSIKIKKNNLIVFHLAINITSEFCRQFNSNIIYPSYISVLCRQIIEQISLIKEIEEENIDEKIIVEASIEAYNKQLGAANLNIKDINYSNQGLLKIFKDKKTYGKLARKYKYGYMYNFFSGDIHVLSQINKLLPFQTKSYETFYNIYFKSIFSLLKDYFFSFIILNKN